MITKYKLFESKKDVFEIGTKVICSKGVQSGREMGGAYGHIMNIIGDGTIYAQEGLNKGLLYLIKFKYWPNEPSNTNMWWVHHKLVHLYDEELEKHWLEKIENLRIKYKDIDPLGEEDWDDED